MSGIDLKVGQKVAITTVTDGVVEVIYGYFAGANSENYVLRTEPDCQKNNKMFINRSKITKVETIPD
jgi:hypothetical protein